MKPNPEVLGILEGALAQARRGEIQGVFLLSQDRRGEYSTDYYAPDVGDMRYELGTAIMQMQGE